MAIRKLDKSFVPNTKEIKYLSKTFPQFRQNLIDFARVYYPDTYADFNESSPGMMFIEMASYVGDVLSYYIDAQFRENLIQYAEEQDNIIAIAQSLGYRPKPSTAAIAEIDVFQICPAKGAVDDYEPDERFMLRINSNMVLTAPAYSSTFRTSRIIDFSDPIDREITVLSVNGFNNPVTYLIRKRAKASAGVIKTASRTFGSPERFTKITLTDEDVLEVIGIEDENGYKWYEVDYLAQDLVFEDKINTRTASETESSSPLYIVRIKRTPRRFTTRYDSNFYLELNFGSGVLEDTDEIINLESKKIFNDEYQTNLASTALDPSDFLSTRSYGLTPSNTELHISYVVGGGLESNVPANAINKITTLKILNDVSGFDATERELFEQIRTSIEVTNSSPATGGKGSDTVEEIRQNASAFFNAQNRLVTPEDYMVRCYAMPPKYGGVAKVFVIRDEQINDVLRLTNDLAPTGGTFVDNRAQTNLVNLYVLGYNNNKKLTRLNADTKKNLKTYLETYRILTDEIHILDAFVINIGVNFRVTVYKNYNVNEVLARCISAISEFFLIDRWQVNQPIIINDLLMEIAQVDGVQSVTYLAIVNKYRFQNGSDYEDYLYDIASATERGIVYPSLDASVFELRYPERDIVGNAIQ